MKDSFLKKIKKIPRYFWVLLAIVLVGVFLRTYHFHDWLRSNMDQGRDSLLVGSVINGDISPPLLGPRASGTQFKLGPIFYYFQIASAEVFGSYPDKLAYPDLIASILCIPLLFFFLRKYFDQLAALSATALFAVSFFIIEYSRFAWNPNSTPFWTILSLYGLHSIISKREKRKALWAVLAGISIGVVIQLHTMSLFFFAIIVTATFGYLYLRKTNLLRYLLVILVFATICNIPQLINEFQTHGQNSKEFAKGVIIQLQKPTIWSKSITHNSVCWVENDIYSISGYEISDSCDLKIDRKHSVEFSSFVLGVIFLVGGVFLGVKYLWQEKDWDKKAFLSLIFFYMLIAYVLGVFLADELVMRYFMMMALFPFVLVAFWIKAWLEKFKDWKMCIAFVAILLLIMSNLFFIRESFAYFVEAERGEHSGSTLSDVTLKEIEGVAQFIAVNSIGDKVVYLDGKNQLVKKCLNSINFLVQKSGTQVLSYKKNNMPPGRVFYLAGRKSSSKRKMLKKSNPLIPYALSGRLLVYLKN